MADARGETRNSKRSQHEMEANDNERTSEAECSTKRRAMYLSRLSCDVAPSRETCVAKRQFEDWVRRGSDGKEVTVRIKHPHNMFLLSLPRFVPRSQDEIHMSDGVEGEYVGKEDVVGLSYFVVEFARTSVEEAIAQLQNQHNKLDADPSSTRVRVYMPWWDFFHCLVHRRAEAALAGGSLATLATSKGNKLKKKNRKTNTTA